MKPVLRILPCILALFSPWLLAQTNPNSVTIAGSFQAALGCDSDWMPACETTHLIYNNVGDFWTASFDLPAGSYEYKAALNNDWGENYGLNATANGANIPLVLSTDTTVTFFYDHKTHWVTDNINSVIATVPGSYQNQVGCSDNWRPDCMSSWLQDPDGDGTYSFKTAISPGTYEVKVAINRNWTENYGANGERDGANIGFSVGPSEVVTFSYNPTSHILTITTELVVGSGDTVTLVGDLQDEIGCPVDWTPDCSPTYLNFDNEDQVWHRAFLVPPGEYQYKVALNNSWDENYGANGQAGGANLTLRVVETTNVRFYFNPSNHWVTDSVSTPIATLAGSFQKALGCGSDWDPSCLRTWLQDVDGDGIYTFSTSALPFGVYECKVAINESWGENYGANGEPGGANISFLVPRDNGLVDFSYNAATHVLTVDTHAGTTPPPQVTAEYAIVHYYREDGDYGDPFSSDYTQYWGLHLWGEAVDPVDQTQWTSPKGFIGEGEYGRFAWIKLSGKPGPINFIVHRGDTKDGSEADRSFVPAESGFQLFLVGGDGTNYPSQAAAQGFATLRYHRADGNYGSAPDTYWGLHLWGEAIAAETATDWNAPRAADGVDSFGAYWYVPVVDPSKPLNFIVHQPGGDNTAPGGNREPGGDRSFVPAEQASAWLIEQDTRVHASQGSAQGYATLHYHRPEADFGDYNSPDYHDFWGMHNWDGAASPAPAWDQPIKPVGFDDFGAIFQIQLSADAPELAYILHRGDTKDPGPDQRLVFAKSGHEVWQLQGANPELPYILPVSASEGGGVYPGNIAKASAYWLTRDTLLWASADDPSATYQLHYAPAGGMTTSNDGIQGGDYLTLTPTTAIDPQVLVRFPHLIGLPALRIAEADLGLVEDILKGQIAISRLNAEGKSQDASGLQIPGVLDDLYAYDGHLGLNFDNHIQFALWAPTARTVTLRLHAGPNTEDLFQQPMTWDNGVWRTTVPLDQKGHYYTYDVEVYVHSTGQVEHNIVTDPYSVGLSRNSERSLILDLDDPATKPAGWDNLAKPSLGAPEDISIYELHMRDFSVADPLVQPDLKGKFKAFTVANSHGVQHLQALQQAGLTHLHLLPVFDIATIDEDPEQIVEPDPSALAAAGPASELQQQLVNETRDSDAFNWGYDPYHYNVPEGSYATNPNGPTRTIEFREMVAAINRLGLRVVMDVVYNHTNASGQNARSVLDRVVPGYYHRLDNQGNVEKSTCCENTATEHHMMGKLMVDSLVLWAKAYKVDAFRFDLMGHHMVSNMQAVKSALQSLTVEHDGVDGSKIYIYGEGWNFGEVANNQRGRNATQLNLGGQGIGTFSDRLRDAVRGGSPFDNGDALLNQGFANGLYYDPNDHQQNDPRGTLLLQADRIRVGLAGNLANYSFTDRNGNIVKGSQVDYNGQPAGYTLDPQENICYISKHDNQTLFDINAYRAPLDTTMAERVRIQIVGLSLVALSQGVPFFHAGSDLLRSKSLDRDSYNSGDWFNRLDFTYQHNNFGVGLPIAEKNQDNWYLMAPLLANPALRPAPLDIERCAEMFQDLLQVRASSPLFHLRTAQDVQDRLTFYNTGPTQIPGLIAMHISDTVGTNLDPNATGMMVIFNATTHEQTLQSASLAKRKFDLHPAQANGVDPVVKTAVYRRAGSFVVPARTTAVFVEQVPPTPLQIILAAIAEWRAAGHLTARQADHLSQLATRFNGDPGGLRYYFNLSVERYVDQGYLTRAQADYLLEIAGEI